MQAAPNEEDADVENDDSDDNDDSADSSLVGRIVSLVVVPETGEAYCVRVPTVMVNVLQ
ncbi:hypothetical protein ABVN80_11180 [Acinetobacter baumannii]